jgi:hypothetical protein
MAIPENERIDALFATSERLIAEMDAAIQNKDLAAQRLIALKVGGVELEFKRIGVGHRLSLYSMMAPLPEPRNQQEHRENLLNAFKIVAGIRRTAHDLADDELHAETSYHLRTILSGLDAIKPEGRLALSPFLDSHDLDVRACAAVELIDLMPDRAIPVLRDLAKNAAGTDAGGTAIEWLQYLARQKSGDTK